MPAALSTSNLTTSTNVTLVNKDGFTQLDPGISLGELEGRGPAEQVSVHVTRPHMNRRQPHSVVGGTERAPYPAKPYQRRGREPVDYALGRTSHLSGVAMILAQVYQSSVRQQVESELDMANTKIESLQRRIDLGEYTPT